ncbi:hypothetical protein [Nonomuraea sp. NPDC049709]|uniref:hypothetical protein n=1 Tax=Nonomuraea sp. NPDC049709 TaxID=3154736 RepID=UPI003436F1C9
MVSNWMHATGQPEVRLTAGLVCELVERIVSAPRRLFGGGWAVLAEPGTVHRPAGGLLVLDEDLAVVGRFPVPEDIFTKSESSKGWPWYWVDIAFPECRFDVSPDRKFAVFAGIDRIVVVDRDGGVRWQVRHPVRFSTACEDDDIPRPSCAVFSADGAVLWTFVPAEEAGGGNPAVERWHIDVASWHITMRAVTQYGLDTNVLVHRDGRHAGYGFVEHFVVDSGEPDGHWVRWADDGTEEVVISDKFTPVDIHPDGEPWLAISGDDHALCIGDFQGGPVREILPLAGVEDDDWEVYEDAIDELLAACLLSRDLALTCLYDNNLEGVEATMQVIFGTNPPQRRGIVCYPPNSEVPTDGQELDSVVVRSAGDGTWLTFAPVRGVGLLKRWHFRDPV